MECQIQRRRRHLRPPPLCPPTATTCPPGVGGAPSSTGAPPPALPCPTGMYVGTCAGTVASNPNALKARYKNACNLPMNPYVPLLVGWPIGLSVIISKDDNY